jgi:MFS family permease
MFMQKCQGNSRMLMVSILSLSLLTVMAGAAVAPALGVIQTYFADSNPLFVQMVISVPAIFIVITNIFFPRLCQRFGAKTLVVAGLLLYTVGGCVAGAFNHIGLVLIMRALVGVGVGIIMPLSTGLLAFYFAPEQQEGLMGYSSAMNQMGGVVATLLSGVLANISWRASFLVYLLGLGSLILCLLFLPNDKVVSGDQQAAPHKTSKVFQENYNYIIAMFLLMTTFFVYPANFAMETSADGVIPTQYIAVIMAMMDFVAFCGGLLFVRMKVLCGNQMRFLAPILFLLGYFLLAFVGGWIGTLSGSICIGFANGVGIPFIISEASIRLGKAAATTVMPLISAALYLAQFLSPVLMSTVTASFGAEAPQHLPYDVAIGLAFLFCLWSTSLPVGKRMPKK